MFSSNDKSAPTSCPGRFSFDLLNLSARCALCLKKQHGGLPCCAEHLFPSPSSQTKNLPVSVMKSMLISPSRPGDLRVSNGGRAASFYFRTTNPVFPCVPGAFSVPLEAFVRCSGATTDKARLSLPPVSKKD